MACSGELPRAGGHTRGLPSEAGHLPPRGAVGLQVASRHLSGSVWGRHAPSYRAEPGCRPRAGPTLGPCRATVWLEPTLCGGGHRSGLSPHPCHRLAFQRQECQRLLCWGLLGTAPHGTHWAHSLAGQLGEVSWGRAGAVEPAHALLRPRDSPNSAPTPTARRPQGMLTLILSRI